MCLPETSTTYRGSAHEVADAHRGRQHATDPVDPLQEVVQEHWSKCIFLLSSFSFLLATPYIGHNRHSGTSVPLVGDVIPVFGFLEMRLLCLSKPFRSQLQQVEMKRSRRNPNHAQCRDELGDNRTHIHVPNARRTRSSGSIVSKGTARTPSAESN